MLFVFQGDMTPTNAGQQLQALWDVLQANGVTRLANLQVSLLGWNNNGSVEVVGKDKQTITQMSFAPPSRKPDEVQQTLVPRTSILQISNDMETKPRRGLYALLGDA